MPQENIHNEISEEITTKYESNFKKHRFFIISYGSLLIIIFTLGIIAIIITGACNLIP